MRSLFEKNRSPAGRGLAIGLGVLMAALSACESKTAAPIPSAAAQAPASAAARPIASATPIVSANGGTTQGVTASRPAQHDWQILVGDDMGAAKGSVAMNSLIWAQAGAYKAGDADAGDQLGYSVAIAGDHAVVGAAFDDQAGTDSGAAYIFTMDSQGIWTQQAKILGPAAGSSFGSRVAIENLGGDRRIVVGAPQDSGGNGLVAWFRGRGNSYVREAEFTDSGQFGASVAAAGGRVLVGGPAVASGDGVAILYEADGALMPPWGEAAVIQGVAASGEQLGSSVALDGDVALLGAPKADGAATDSGVAYVYERSGTTWVQTATLKASDATASDGLGYAVALSGRTAVASTIAKNSMAGAAYVYTSPLGAWAQQARLHTVTGISLTANDLFGSSVSIVGNLVAVGASGTAGAGAVYVFSRSGTAWSLSNTVAARVPTTGEIFGASASIDRGLGHIVVGAPGNSGTATTSGAFYDIIQEKPIGDPCALTAECASGFCVDGVCCQSSCGGGVDSDCQACANVKTGLADGVCAAAISTFVCRPAAGGCDQAEVCNGAALTCPADTGPMVMGTVCRAAAPGGCDVAEVCSGTSTACPADAVAPAQAVCRPPVGACDAAERCDGQTKVCPADLLKPSFTVCRLPSGECDAFEVCDGMSPACPNDNGAVDGTTCSGGSCQAGMCRAEANLSISVFGPPPSESGQPVTDTVTVVNAGKSAAQSVSLTITLPAGASAQSPSSNGWSCQSQGLTATCTRPSLGAGEISQLLLVIVPPDGSERIMVDATVTATTFDPDMTNNSASFDQSVLSARISGGGVGTGCSAVPGGGAGMSSFAAMALLFAIGGLRRRRRS